LLKNALSGYLVAQRLKPELIMLHYGIAKAMP
jgi:hypothetical protein